MSDFALSYDEESENHDIVISDGDIVIDNSVLTQIITKIFSLRLKRYHFENNQAEWLGTRDEGLTGNVVAPLRTDRDDVLEYKDQIIEALKGIDAEVDVEMAGSQVKINISIGDEEYAIFSQLT